MNPWEESADLETDLDAKPQSLASDELRDLLGSFLNSAKNNEASTSKQGLEPALENTEQRMIEALLAFELPGAEGGVQAYDNPDELSTDAYLDDPLATLPEGAPVRSKPEQELVDIETQVRKLAGDLNLLASSITARGEAARAKWVKDIRVQLLREFDLI